MIATIMSFALGVVLITAGVLKLRSNADVGEIVELLFPALGRRMRSLLAVSFPWVEIVLGAACLLPNRPWHLWLLVSLMFGMFSVVALWMILLDKELNCRCFGEFFRTTKRGMFVRALSLLMLGLLGTVLSSISTPELSLVELLLAYLSAASLCLCSGIALEAADVSNAIKKRRQRTAWERTS